MTNRYFLVLALAGFLVLTGCTSQQTPPPSSFEDRSQTDYSFTDVSESCNIHTNVNVSNDTSPCVAPRKELAVFYTNDTNWSIMCCEFSASCTSNNATDSPDVCVNANDGQYNGYVYNDDGFWLAQCCNDNGGSCYIDTSINISDDSTVCDEDYHQNTYSLEYNDGLWDAMCCVGGLDE